MKKDLDSWCARKKELNEVQPNFYKEREIRWCSLGINIGSEQDGTSKTYRRPVLVIKGFSRNVCLILPLTTSVSNNPYYFPIGKIEGKNSSVILSQIRLIDTKRLHDSLGYLNKIKFEEIKKAFKKLI